MVKGYFMLKVLTINVVRHLSVSTWVGLILAVSLSVQAQSDTDQLMESIKGNRWAILIGIADYPSSEGFQIQQLKAPVKDVNALAEFLKDPEKGGFDSENIFILTDEEATRRNILITFNDIAKRAGPEDMVIFYFSGHGARLSDSETTYLIPYDHDLRDVETTCIDFDDLASKIRKMEASKVIVILDACHSGGVKPVGARATGSMGIVARYLKAFEASEGRALLLSSDQAEVSWETKDSGIFTHFLLEGLNGAADANDDGIVTFTEASAYVEEAVPKHTREHFPRIQKPTRRYEFGQVRGDIPLAINRRKVNIQKQENLLNGRNVAIFRVSLTELDDALKDFSLQVAKSVYDKALKDEPLTQQESLLLKEIDALRSGEITASDYVTRARAIHDLGRAELRISVNPADAMVELASVDAPELAITPSAPNIYKVDRGEYNLSVQRAGYRSSSRQVTVGEINSQVAVELEKLTGTLQLQVSPADAEIAISVVSIAAPDAEVMGSRSVRIQPTGESSLEKLPVGTYKITARKEGYERATEELVEIKADAPTSVNLMLRPIAPNPARIVGTGLPADTRVLVDGVSVSLPYEVPPGTHGIRLERNGFQAVEMSRELGGGQVLPLNPVWIPSTGTLQVHANPQDAIITVTPISIATSDTEIKVGKDLFIQAPGRKEIPAGTYRVTATREGYESVVKESIQIRANDIAELTLTLKPLKPSGSIIKPGSIPRPGRGVQLKAFAASMAVPGLGQHLQGHRQRGLIYEAAVIGTGAVTVWAFIKYNKASDHYEDVRTQLINEASKQYEITPGISALETKHEDTYDKAKSRRTLATATQIVFGIVWGINALDAGFMMPAQSSSGIVFEARPTSEGGQILVRASF